MYLEIGGMGLHTTAAFTHTMYFGEMKFGELSFDCLRFSDLGFGEMGGPPLRQFALGVSPPTLCS